MRHGKWKSQSAMNGYLTDSKTEKRNIANMLAGNGSSSKVVDNHASISINPGKELG